MARAFEVFGSYESEDNETNKASDSLSDGWGLNPPGRIEQQVWTRRDNRCQVVICPRAYDSRLA